MREYPTVRSKYDFVRRYQAGEFGNRVRTWSGLKSFIEDDIPSRQPLLHIRNRVAGGATFYNVPADQLAAKWKEVTTEGLANANDLYISEMAPEDKKVFQGELTQYAGQPAYRLYCNFQPLPMREGFAKEERWAAGIVAKTLLDQYLCPNSRAWMDVLLERYPGHVIEFSAYSCEVGVLPGFNTIIWEVRSY